MKTKFFKFISFFLAVLVFASCFVIPSFGATSPIGFTFATRIGPAVQDSLTELGFSGFVIPDEDTETTLVGPSINHYTSSDKFAVAQIRIQREDSSILCESGDFDFQFKSVFFRNYDDIYNIGAIQYYIQYTDNTAVGYFESVNTSASRYSYGSGYMYQVDDLLTFEKDVKYIYMRVYFHLPTPDESRDNFSLGYGHNSITLEKVTWLNKVITIIRNTLTNVFNTISNLFSSVVNGFGTVISNLQDLVRHLVTGGFITDIQNFFTSIFTFPLLTEFTDLVNSYLQEEGFLIDDAQDTLDDINDGLRNFLSENGNILTGIFGASAVLNIALSRIPALSPILWFSLYVGIIGFVLGVSWLVGQWLRREPHKEDFQMKMKF